MVMRNFSFSAAILLLFSLIWGGCSRQADYQVSEGGVWNTTFRIVYRCNRPLGDSIRAVMKQVEMSLSPFNDSSTISRINRGETAMTDSLVRRVFIMSQKINAASDGMFDPTVSPLVDLWGFGWKNTGREPLQAEIDSAASLVGIDSCRLLPDGTIAKKHAATQFNFSAITKGYGVDLVAEMLHRNGCSDYLVEIGGEIAMRGTNPRGEAWRVMIDAPVSNDTSVTHSRMTVISPQTAADPSAAVATSGNYRNFRITESGERVWHTIDPRTGRPATSETLSATVIAPSCAIADALATACMAMPLSRATAMIDSLGSGYSCLIVTPGPDSTYILHPSARFPAIN